MGRPILPERSCRRMLLRRRRLPGTEGCIQQLRSRLQRRSRQELLRLARRMAARKRPMGKRLLRCSLMCMPLPPREETPEYAKAHHHLVYVLDSPCAMCGVRQSTLKDPKENPFGATAIETHHYPIERSLVDACDPAKVGVVFPEVKDRASLEAFVDSEHNLMVLCDIHHRHPLHGIHHLVPQDFFVQPFLLAGYQVVGTQQDEAQVMAQDEQLIEKEERR